MKTADNITITDGRMSRALEKNVSPFVQRESKKIVEKEVEKTKLKTGKVTKFFPYLDKVEVKLTDGKSVLCKILHRYGTDLLDLYTPLADRREFDNKLKEPCYIPRYALHCVVLNIDDKKSDEYLLLGYYQKNEFIGLNPAKPGNLKLVSQASSNNQFWIKFGYEGLDLRLPSKSISINTGDRAKDMEEMNYVKSDEVYTKEEVEKLIAEKIEEALNNMGNMHDVTG